MPAGLAWRARRRSSRLPIGRRANAAATALRESKEEIGLDPEWVKVVGLLDDYATSSGFVITPVVGYVAAHASFALDPAEVAEAFGQRTAPEGVKIYNPAFDVTPHRYIAAMITENGIIERPDTASIRGHFD